MAKFNASKEYQAFVVVEKKREMDSYVLPISKLSMNDYENYLLLTIDSNVELQMEELFDSIVNVFNQFKVSNHEFADKTEGYRYEYLYATEPIIKDYQEMFRKEVSNQLNNDTFNIVPLNWYFTNNRLKIPNNNQYLYILNVANSQLMMWQDFIEKNNLKFVENESDDLVYNRPLEGAFKLNVSKNGIALPLINNKQSVAVIQRINTIHSYSAINTLKHQLLYWEVNESNMLKNPKNMYQPIISNNACFLEPSLEMNEWLKSKVGNELFDVYKMLHNRL